jgi:hypothetical protein
MVWACATPASVALNRAAEIHFLLIVHPPYNWGVFVL